MFIFCYLKGRTSDEAEGMEERRKGEAGKRQVSDFQSLVCFTNVPKARAGPGAWNFILASHVGNRGLNT